MPVPAAPAADAKIGAKIDYVAKCLGERLKPHGFTRKNRVLHRTLGDGVAACTQLIDLQGDKWNEGRRGKFTVNLGVCFPALLELQAGLPGLEWIAQHVKPNDIAFGPGGFQGRLNNAVPPQRDTRWPSELKHGEDFWAQIEDTTDLAALAEGVALAVFDHALPWLDARSRLAAFGAFDAQEIGAPGPRESVLAALLLGDAGLAAQRARDTAPHRLAQNPQQLDALLALLSGRGVNVEGIAWTPVPADPMRVRRSAHVETLKQSHQEKVQDFLRQGDHWEGREDALLDAWIHAAAASQLQDDARKLSLWPLVERASPAARRELLLRAIERLPERGPTIKSTIANVWASYDNYHLHAWTELAKALLAVDAGPCEEAQARALLLALGGTADLVEEELTSDRFRTPFPAVVRWIGQHATPPVRHAVRQAIGQLLDAVRDAAIARSNRRYSSPLPKGIFDEALQAQLEAGRTPAAAAQMVALYRQFPERAFGPVDRDAILLLKRWRRAEADGRVPLQLEEDDWGRQLSAAIDAMPPARREPLVALLEWFDDGVEAKPTKRWWADLARRADAFDRAFLVGWLADTLPRFSRTTLEHVSATPGIGAFPGETSGRVLLGLVHLAGMLDGAVLTAALQAVVSAAYTLIPGQRLRFQSAGTAALRPLAQSVEGREFLTRLSGSMKQKPVRKAIDDALAGSPG